MMALVHDMAESIVGDITPFDGVSKGILLKPLREVIVDEKHRREVEAMNHLTSLLPGQFSPNAQLLQDLFDEYEEGTSPGGNSCQGCG